MDFSIPRTKFLPQTPTSLCIITAVIAAHTRNIYLVQASIRRSGCERAKIWIALRISNATVRLTIRIGITVTTALNTLSQRL